jgi:hydrogenase expression/formation protein HypE
VQFITDLGKNMDKGSEKILLAHGAGGELSRKILHRLVLRYFHSPSLALLSDSGLLPLQQGMLSYTTDSYVINPIFFPGGDIGKLSICGTINDLAVSGAIPKALTFACIVEEGMDIGDLEKIFASAAKEAEIAKAEIVAGDFKVVEKGAADSLFITTSGIGLLHPLASLGYKKISSGDAIIVTGTLGDHSAAITLSRGDFSIRTEIKSDCASLSPLLLPLFDLCGSSIHSMRDLTRGGLATTLCELSDSAEKSFLIEEGNIPIKKSVATICDLFGYDPLYLANEGKAVIFCDSNDSPRLLSFLQSHPLGKDAKIIGRVLSDKESRVVMHTKNGGKRLIEMLQGDQLPRIC